jgi:hypothetical protein
MTSAQPATMPGRRSLRPGRRGSVHGRPCARLQALASVAASSAPSVAASASASASASAASVAAVASVATPSAASSVARRACPAWPRGVVRWVVEGFAAAGAAIALAASAIAQTTALQVPARDDEIVERLPAHVGDAAARRAARAAERAQRLALQQHPDELGLALEAAGDALARARLHGDPRELGTVEAALAPWWTLADPPPAVRLVRATVRQSQHDFAHALEDLDALLDAPVPAPLPLRAQAELTRSAVHQVLGQFAPAEAGCRRLAGPAFAALGASTQLSAQACLAELASLQGRADTAAATLARLAGAPDAGSAATAAGAPAPAWLDLMRAELAQRRGDVGAGALFAAALAANPDVYTRCAYADWLLEQHRAAEAVQLLQGYEAADPVLLRLALAYRQLHGPRHALTVTATRTLGERFAAALLRGDRSHGREQSRYALELRDDTRAALALAAANWHVQHEPADALALVRAARGAQRADAAQPVWQFLRETGGTDVRLGPVPEAPVNLSATLAAPAATLLGRAP